MSEEAWKRIASRLTYCHGTSSKFVNSILKYGLLPRKTDGVRPSAYEGELESRNLDSVYLSIWLNSIPGFCNVAAENAAKKFGGEPVVVNVKLDPDDFDRYVRDEDSWSDDYRDLFKDACEFSLKTGMGAACFDPSIKREVERAIGEGLITREQACRPPKWFAELACFQRFAIRNGIPREKITGVERTEEIRKGR
jgi:hypothetical protein